MPRLVQINAAETQALIALRRSLWQLAFVGVTAAVTLTQVAPQSHLLALWCVVLPLVALVVHFRHALFDTVVAFGVAFGVAHAEPISVNLKQRPQARRARSELAASSRRQSRMRHPAPARIGPRAG